MWSWRFSCGLLLLRFVFGVSSHPVLQVGSVKSAGVALVLCQFFGGWGSTENFSKQVCYRLVAVGKKFVGFIDAIKCYGLLQRHLRQRAVIVFHNQRLRQLLWCVFCKVFGAGNCAVKILLRFFRSSSAGEIQQRSVPSTKHLNFFIEFFRRIRVGNCLDVVVEPVVHVRKPGVPKCDFFHDPL